MSYIYIYMELLVKPELLTSYIYGPGFSGSWRRSWGLDGVGSG
jgi:hypothetical protein